MEEQGRPTKSLSGTVSIVVPETCREINADVTNNSCITHVNAFRE
jgi:hypothetical protein